MEKPKLLRQRQDSVVLPKLMNLRDQELNRSHKRSHEDHIARKRENSVLHYNLVHEFIPMHQAIKIPDAKAAVDKEWKKLETIAAWRLDTVKSKKEVIKEAQKNNNEVHFAPLTDLCHLKNAELEPQFQKYKGRVVLRVGCCERRLWSLCSIH